MQDAEKRRGILGINGIKVGNRGSTQDSCRGHEQLLLTTQGTGSDLHLVVRSINRGEYSGSLCKALHLVLVLAGRIKQGGEIV